MNELINQVEQWSKDKGLNKAESSKQMLKVVEETGEVAAALARGNQDMLRDGIGDVVVTLIILAQQNDMDLYECLNTAYDEIKGRTGKMVDGVFVKAADLEFSQTKFRVSDLDIKIKDIEGCELVGHEKTLREQIREDEERFEMNPMELNCISDNELNMHIDYLVHLDCMGVQP